MNGLGIRELHALPVHHLVWMEEEDNLVSHHARPRQRGRGVMPRPQVLDRHAHYNDVIMGFFEDLHDDQKLADQIYSPIVIDISCDEEESSPPPSLR